MKRIVGLLICCALPVILPAQVKVIELSHYLFPEFTKGAVLLKTGVSYDAALNYNSLTEEMVFEERGKVLALGNDVVEQVDTVFITGRKFITIAGRFVELVYASAYNLYAEHKCRVNEPGKPAGYGGTSRTSASSSYSSYQSGGVYYELSLPDGYEVKPYTHYWLSRGGVASRFVNMRQLERLFADKRDAFRDYVRNNNVQLEDQDSMIQLIMHLEAH
jgi:hypothetical protein